MGKALELLSEAGRESAAEEILTVVKVEGGKVWAHCPFHSEKTPGNAFNYKPSDDVGYCFSCGEVGDLIGIYNGINGREKDDKDGFREFVSRYAPNSVFTSGQDKPVQKTVNRAWEPSQLAYPESRWQQKAARWVDHCVDRLQADSKRLAWLEGYGIKPETARAAKLGWNERDKYPTFSSWGLPAQHKEDGKDRKIWLPVGLVLPVFWDGKLRKVKVRRDDPSQGPSALCNLRYYEVRGSAQCYAIYGKGPADIVVVVETERDALFIWQECRGLNVVAMATGGASKRPDALADVILRNATVIVNALDCDEAGAVNAVWWMQEYPMTKRWPVPSRLGKDVGDAYRAGLNVREWVSAALPRKQIKVEDVEVLYSRFNELCRQLRVMTIMYGGECEIVPLDTMLLEKNMRKVDELSDIFYKRGVKKYLMEEFPEEVNQSDKCVMRMYA